MVHAAVAATHKTRVLVVDNYDSFTFNLVQYLRELGAECEVWLSDTHSVDDIAELSPDKILISPGPGSPKDAGMSTAVVERFAGAIPILGVCLGLQAIAVAFGGDVVAAPRIMHGKASPVVHSQSGIFAGLPSPMMAGRYHSLVVDAASLPSALEVTAWTDDGVPGRADKTIMGLRHVQLDVEGVQFHPESILTPAGKALLGNWLCANAREVVSRRATLLDR